MKKIYIVGGNGFARECYDNLTTLRDYGKEIEFGGFFGHGGYGHTVDYKDYQPLYKGEVSEHEFKENEYCIIGAGYPEIRKKIYLDLKRQNAKFYNLITNYTYLTNTAVIGEANIIIGLSILSVNTRLGDGNVLNGDVNIGHDAVIGDFNFFGPRSLILGNVKVGNDNTIGANAILLPNCKVGNHNSVAPLSAVYKGCKNNCYMLGNPALKVGAVCEKGEDT